MNISITSLIQSDQLNASQTARANLVAGTLLGTRKLSFEKGFDEWIEVLLGSYVCQSSPAYDFHAELSGFAQFIEQNLICERSIDLKHSISEDIEMTLK